MNNEHPSVPYGYCHCGCGRKTRLRQSADATRGWRRGDPALYLPGHKGKPGCPYKEEDRGFTTPCWVWQRWVGKNGYGYMKRGGKELLAHRVFYERVHGPIPKGLVAHHRCEQSDCVNPDHLELLNRGEHAWLHYRKNRRADA